MSAPVDSVLVPTPPETASRGSRRALLAGALGGLGAWAATAVGRRSPVMANDPNDVVLGAANPTTAQTSITNHTNGNTVFVVSSTSGIALYGSSTSDTAVYGKSFGVGTAVYGSSSSGQGVYADSGAADQPASVGRQYNNGTGVVGYSSGVTGVLPAAKPKTGMYGYANQDSAARGVWGHSPAGIGLYGQTSTGYAGYFLGKVFSTSFYELAEIATPGAPGANKARLFMRDNGAGKSQLCVRFATGSVKLLATEG